MIHAIVPPFPAGTSIGSDARPAGPQAAGQKEK